MTLHDALNDRMELHMIWKALTARPRLSYLDRFLLLRSFAGAAALRAG